MVALTFGELRVRVPWANVGNRNWGLGGFPAQACTPAICCSSLTQECGGDVLRDLVP